MDPLTVRNRRQLFALRAACIRALRVLWDAWDPDDAASWPRFAVPATALVQLYAEQAATAGVDYYAALREKTTGLRSMQPPHPDRIPAEVVANSLSATGLAGTYIGIRLGRERAQAKAFAFKRVARAAGRHVVNGARTAVVEASRADDLALGWARKVAGTCAYCAAKAAEGCVPPGESFGAHDGCACVAEPVFEPTRATIHGRGPAGLADEVDRLARDVASDVGTQSRFNGNVIVGNHGFGAEAHWNGAMSLDVSWANELMAGNPAAQKVMLHEFAHLHSAQLTERTASAAKAAGDIALEEAVAEGYAQAFLVERYGTFTLSTAYDGWYKALESARIAAGGEKTAAARLTFYRQLLNVPLRERRVWLTEHGIDVPQFAASAA